MFIRQVFYQWSHLSSPFWLVLVVLSILPSHVKHFYFSMLLVDVEVLPLQQGLTVYLKLTTNSLYN